MTKTEQLRAGILASGAKRIEARTGRYEVYETSLATRIRNPADGSITEAFKTWYLFLGKGAGLRISKTQNSSHSIPVGALQYATYLEKGKKSV